MNAAVLVVSFTLVAQLDGRYLLEERYGIANQSRTGDVAASANQGAASANQGAASANQGAASDNGGAASANERFAPQSEPPVSVPASRPTKSNTQRSEPQKAAAPPVTPVNAKPAALMREMLTPPTRSRLEGTPVRLFDVVRNAPSRQQQTMRINAYWDLCSAVADYYLGLREQQELQHCRKRLQSVGQLWREAESVMEVRVATSLRAAIASQYNLASFLGHTDGMPLPLPGDLPHCGDYHTKFARVFAGRRSPEAEQLNELLPLRYEELNGTATEVIDAEEFLELVTTNLSPTSDGKGVIEALELLALQRRAFVQIAKDYNRRIARYAELATPGQIGTERLVAMLIKQDREVNTATRSNTPPPPPGRQSRRESAGPPQTFVRDWVPRGQHERAADETIEVDEAVVPASVQSDGQGRQAYEHERSVLVREPDRPHASAE